MADRGPRERPYPLPCPFSRHHCNVELAVVRARVFERRDPAADGADVGHQHAAGLLVEPDLAVDLDLRFHGSRAHVASARPDVGSSAEAVFQTSVCIADHQRVEAESGHDGEMFAVHLPDVQGAVAAVQPHLHALLEVDGDAQVVGQQVGSARGDDRDRDVGSDCSVDAALHAAVTTPNEDQLRAELHRLLEPGGSLATLRDLEPNRVGHTLLVEHVAQPAEAGAEHLLAMGDHGYFGHCPLRGVEVGGDVSRGRS